MRTPVGVPFLEVKKKMNGNRIMYPCRGTIHECEKCPLGEKILKTKGHLDECPNFFGVH
jgi:hypothetical protein